MGLLPTKQLKQSDQFRILLNCDAYFQQEIWKQLSESDYNKFCIIGSDDTDRLRLSPRIKKAIASLD